ncbi:Nephrocystin-1 [Manis pentadactyla]|nr:Nephrocystin-1 [Manis pentadactyla]
MSGHNFYKNFCFVKQGPTKICEWKSTENQEAKGILSTYSCTCSVMRLKYLGSYVTAFIRFWCLLDGILQITSNSPCPKYNLLFLPGRV